MTWKRGGDDGIARWPVGIALAVVAAAAIGFGLAGRDAGETGSDPEATFEFVPEERMHTLMPIPAELEFGRGQMSIEPDFSVAVDGEAGPRVERAIGRLLERLAETTGPAITKRPATGDHPTLLVRSGAAAGAAPGPDEDESYSLSVEPDGAILDAAGPYGVLRGIETFLQLVSNDPTAGWSVPVVRIRDAPRFPWRGLLIDACRHWIPPEVLKRNLDAMAALKMNVLHWHLSEDQGFRVESRRFPRLHELGSDGDYYTQDEIREIVAYAADRGIRVVPEFDVPGHATSWLVGYPELAAAPGPYELERRWGVHDPTLDPTREEVFDFLDAFIEEMSGLFPDPYFHIGGDEVNGKQWDANPQIQAFMRENGIEDNHALQAHFNLRLQGILTRHGKRMIGWDEILQPQLPTDIVVQSWRGQESLAEAARRGYRSILSYGYYLDHILTAAFHYEGDPHGREAAELTPEEKALILGGEACMWSEYVSAETFDSRVWPRTAAIAERFWSPAEVTDVDDMYRRLAATSARLETLGLTHRSSYPAMLERLAEGVPIEPLRRLADVLEPVKYYERYSTGKYTSLTPLDRLVDATRPESDTARVFSRLVDELLDDPEGERGREEIERWLTSWHGNHAALRPTLEGASMLTEALPLSTALRDLATVGLEALRNLDSGTGVPEGERARQLAVLERASRAHAELLIMVAPAVGRLVEASFRGRAQTPYTEAPR